MSPLELPREALAAKKFLKSVEADFQSSSSCGFSAHVFVPQDGLPDVDLNRLSGCTENTVLFVCLIVFVF